MKRTSKTLLLAGALGLGLALIPPPAAGTAESNVTTTVTRAEDTNALELLRACLQLQEQLHTTQLAIEQTRKEARELAGQNADALTGRLQAIEQALVAQRSREIESLQSSNRAMLIIAAAVAAVALVATLLMAYFQWRTVHGLTELSSILPVAPRVPLPGLTAPQPEAPLLTAGPVEQSNLRLLGALEQLEKRIYELEHTTRPSLKEPAPAPPANGNGNPGSNGDPVRSDSPAGLLTCGQARLDADDAAGALECFEQVLAAEPANAEALVKKGMALERLQKLNEAIECYDRAIAADNSLTVAYLHKGGLFNRLERFNEALECYEQALQTQEKRTG